MSNKNYFQRDMADVFDISSSKKSRSSYDDSSGKYKDWESSNNQLRRDPRIKSPPSTHDIDDNAMNRTQQNTRDSRQQTQEEQQTQIQENWQQNPTDYMQYGMTRNSWHDQQYNTVYPPPQSSYQYSGRMSGAPPSTMQSDYTQNQYQVPVSSYYTSMSGDTSYMQVSAPPPPSWQNQTSTAQEFRGDVPRPPPPPRMHRTPPPPPMPSQRTSSESKSDDLKKEAAIQEGKQQRAIIRKQRDEYIQKAALLKRELEVLQRQKEELLAEVGSGSIPRETQRILKENTKLQVEIQSKLKAINDVIEVLVRVDENTFNRERQPPTVSSSSAGTSGSASGGGDGKSSKESSERVAATSSSTTTVDSSSTGKPIYNYVHYDPELHWCRICDVFPNSAKDFLMHLLSDKHRETTKQHQLVDMPWHNIPAEIELPSNPDGPAKRTPIKGIQFFIPASAWYCKLCDKWIGDLHCASIHLKSKTHIHNYNHFVEQNPHWETDWISDREKAFARAQNKSSQDLADTSNLTEPCASSLGEHSSDHKNRKRKKRKDKRDSRSSSRDKKKKKKSKKRKKVSSDSSSTSSTSSNTSSDEELESDKSRSIRVAMRNKMKMQAQMILSEELGEKLDVLTKLVEDGTQRKQRKLSDSISTTPDEKQKMDEKSEGMNVVLPKDKDILTFHSFRNRLKQSQQNFKQSQAVSLNLLGNHEKQEFLDEEKKELDKESSSSRGGGARPNERESYEKERDKFRYSDEKKYEKKKYDERHSSPLRKRYDRYNSPERKHYGSPRKYDRYGGSPSDRKRNIERYAEGDYSRERDRDRDRERERERDRDRDRDRDREKRLSYNEDKYMKKSENSKYSSKDDRNYKKDRDDKKDDSKSSEKGDNDDKDKMKFPVMTLQQKKLPLIGRMPLFKKKQDTDEKKTGGDNDKNENSMMKSKFSTNYDAKNNLPAPGLVHITSLSTPSEFKFTAENPPPPPQIIPDPPMIIPEPPQISAYMCAPPPPPILSTHMIEPSEEAQMMVMAAPPPPDQEQKGGLPRDLQDALNIIFPGDKTKEEIESEQQQQQQEAMMMAAQYGTMMENYGYTYDSYGMQMIPPLPPDISNTQNTEHTEDDNMQRSKDDPSTEIDDLAMLGIDAEDLAAQNL